MGSYESCVVALVLCAPRRTNRNAKQGLTTSKKTRRQWMLFRKKFLADKNCIHSWIRLMQRSLNQNVFFEVLSAYNYPRFADNLPFTKFNFIAIGSFGKGHTFWIKWYFIYNIAWILVHWLTLDVQILWTYYSCQCFLLCLVMVWRIGITII